MKYFIKACASSNKLTNAARQNVTEYDFRNVNQSIDLGVVPGVPLRILEAAFNPKGTFSSHLAQNLAIRNESQLRKLASSEVVDTVDLLVLRGAKQFLFEISSFLGNLSMIPPKKVANTLDSLVQTYIDPALKETEAAGYGITSTITPLSSAQPNVALQYDDNEVATIRRWGGDPDLAALSKFQISGALFKHGQFSIELSASALAACYKLFLERLTFSAFGNGQEVCVGPYAWVRVQNREPAHLGPYGAKLAGDYVIPAAPLCYARHDEMIDIDCRGAMEVGDGVMLIEKNFPFTCEEMVIIPDASDIKEYGDFDVSPIVLRITRAAQDNGIASESIIGGLY